MILLLSLAGCVSPPVSDLGGGRYHLAVRAEYGSASDRTNAVQQADRYCRKSGKRAVTESFDDQGPFVASPAVGVVFTCN
jgi:hypothetical protein